MTAIFNVGDIVTGFYTHRQKSMMPLVIIESPYAGQGEPNSELYYLSLANNIKYAREAVRDSLLRGEAPIASHLLYTQEGILDDNIPEERMHGINAGLAWRVVAELSAVYVDLGISRGMEYGIKAAKETGIKIAYRRIPDSVFYKSDLTRPN